jgi:hypothetical protein
MEWGAAEIDPKRPYGNTNVIADIAELVGRSPVNEDGDLTDVDYSYCRKLHEQTPTALQIVLSTRSFVPGTYRLKTSYDKDWELVSGYDQT